MSDYEIARDPKTGKAIANLKGRQSEKYTKLANRLEKLQELETEIKEIKSAVKSDTKELIGDLFTAEDTIYTRVVETVSVVFTLSKNPKETETIKYAKVLEDLTEFLTPELITKMDELKKAYTATSQRAPSLKFTRQDEFVDNNTQNILNYCYTFKENVLQWALQYDTYLDDFKNQLVMESTLNNPSKYFKSMIETLRNGY